MEFTGSSARIGISLPADMLEYLLDRKRQDGIPVSVQIQRAIENDIMDRAVEDATPTALTPEQFEAKWAEFLRGKVLVDAPADYRIGPAHPADTPFGEDE